MPPRQLPKSSQQSVVSPIVTKSHFTLERSKHIFVQKRLLHASEELLIMRYNTRLSYQTFLTASSLGEPEAITIQLYIDKLVVCVILQYSDQIHHNCIIRQE